MLRSCCGSSKHVRDMGQLCCATLVQHLPSLFVVVSIISSFVFGTKLSTIPFVLFGTYSAWIYLRFLQLKPELSVRCACGLLPSMCLSTFAHHMWVYPLSLIEVA